MRMAVLCLLAGMCALQWQARLPQDLLPLWLLTLVLAGLPLLPGRWGRALRSSGLVAAFLFGWLWSAWLAQERMQDHLAAQRVGQDMLITGVVTGLPQALSEDRGLRFEFTLDPVLDGVPEKIQLSWYYGRRESPPQADALSSATTRTARMRAAAAAPATLAVASVPQLHAGERWQFTVRLKRPHGNYNPHGFDYEAWMLARNLRATGYVRQGNATPAPERLDAFVVTPASLLAGLRERLRERFRGQLGERSYAGILIALAIGDQASIPASQWQSFARTGITHLMSISGLHVTMLAGLAYAFTQALWRRSHRALSMLAAQRAATLAGVLVALGYALLSGFAVPAQRTCYMLLVAAIALWSQRQWAMSRVLAWALLLVLLLDPWAVLAVGFWLSFGAVAVLLYAASARLDQRLEAGSSVKRRRWWQAWWRSQGAMSLLSIPALLLLFQQFSLVSPLANAVAIPVVSFIVTPLALAAALPGLVWLLEPAYWVLQALMWLIELLATAPWAVWQQAAPVTWTWLLALLGGLWLLLPYGFPARSLGVWLFVPLLWVVPQRPEAQAARVTVLDVGQGLAVHVQTAQHDLLYDTGPRYGPDSEAGTRVVWPYLRAQGVRHLERLVISHQDDDHAGGAMALLAQLPVSRVLSSLPLTHPVMTQAVEAEHCLQGQAWQWDGVRFELLHPEPGQYVASGKRSNDLSCVLKITTPGASLLLPGDIEKRSERALLHHAPDALRADIVLAPHHGSRTSSSEDFVAAVAAQSVIFAVGHGNRFGHPREEVVARYVTLGARGYRTDEAGALHFTLPARRTDKLPITSERQLRPRYWHE